MQIVRHIDWCENFSIHAFNQRWNVFGEGSAVSVCFTGPYLWESGAAVDCLKLQICLGSAWTFSSGLFFLTAALSVIKAFEFLSSHRLNLLHQKNKTGWQEISWHRLNAVGDFAAVHQQGDELNNKQCNILSGEPGRHCGHILHILQAAAAALLSLHGQTLHQCTKWPVSELAWSQQHMVSGLSCVARYRVGAVSSAQCQ